MFIARASRRNRERRAFEFLVQSYAGRIKEGAVAQTGVADARQLVGHRARGLVVIAARLDLGDPLPQAIELSRRPTGQRGAAQRRSRAVRQQHAQVTIPTFRNATDSIGTSTPLTC